MKKLWFCLTQMIAPSGVVSLVAVLLVVSVGLRAQAPVADSPAIEAKAKELLSKLTLAQKIELLGGNNDMYTHAEPVIGLPRLKMSDGPVGVRTWGPTTAYPGGAALAATWDVEMARKVGEGLGRDARARGVNILLGPGVNISRSPLAGRNFEYFSEDPYLNARLVVNYIEGVQSEGVVATVKHFAANNQEYNRHNVDSVVSERVLREIYLPAFEAAVKEAHVDAVMNSYNLVNGSHATQNEFLNLKVLKGEWGFDGVLMSDWESTYDSIGAANNGLDLEMPDARFMNATALLPALQSGQVKQSTIDDKVLRILRLALRYGFLDHDQFDPTVSTYSVADRATALEGARESLTLLKNDGGILPLDAKKIKTIAVIGPDAYPAVPGGGGSSQADAFEPVSLLTGIANQNPNLHVLYSRGLPSMNEIFHRTHWEGNSVHAALFPSKDFNGTPEESNQWNLAMWKEEMWGPEDKNRRSIRYTGTYKAEKSGKYLLLAASSGADAFKVFVDGKETLGHVRSEGQVPQSTTLELTAGQTLNVQVDYVPFTAGIRLGVGIMPESEIIYPDVQKMAAAADVVVVSVGFSPHTEGEGYDRTFHLPWGQDALVDAVIAANQHVIVSYTGGVSADVHRWIDKVPAFLATYYPGQEGGTAFAEVLFGQHNPEGKLPVTFDRSWAESASSAFYYPMTGMDTTLHVTETNGRTRDDVIPHVHYDDGLMVGYRYWTSTGKSPLYPFGFGLSYTSFNFSNLKADPTTAINTLNSDGKVEVGFDVKNTGAVGGAEVAQLYVSDPSAKAKRPERELKGFEKVRLAPGETKHVTLKLDARAFSYWDETAHKWTIDPGKFVIHVGDSSENTPLSAEITLK
jgi:beta-glucosidase